MKSLGSHVLKLIYFTLYVNRKVWGSEYICIDYADSLNYVKQPGFPLMGGSRSPPTGLYELLECNVHQNSFTCAQKFVHGLIRICRNNLNLAMCSFFSALNLVPSSRSLCCHACYLFVLRCLFLLLLLLVCF